MGIIQNFEKNTRNSIVAKLASKTFKIPIIFFQISIFQKFSTTLIFSGISIYENLEFVEDFNGPTNMIVLQTGRD